MCSIIAANRQPGLDLAFLENRDKPRELFLGNDIRKIGNTVGIYDERAKGIACGFSMESGVAGGVANILGYTGNKSRGVLLLHALESGRTIDEVAQFIANEAQKGEYGSASYVLCSSKEIIRIESFGELIHSTRLKGRRLLVATNHLKMLRKGERHRNSVLREQYLKKIRKISVENVIALAKRHRNPSICRHGRTLASFAVFVDSKSKLPKILYSIGEPCKGFKEFKL